MDGLFVRRFADYGMDHAGTGGRISEAAGAKLLAGLRRVVMDNPLNHIVPLSMNLYDDGLELYRARPDKEWSLTDCISFIVMEHENVRDVLTGDRHFEQAGFKALFA